LLLDKNILAVVPARSGSKGIRNKNIRNIRGTTLIGWAGNCLDRLSWLDSKVISTDSMDYAIEGGRYGLDAPFLRPPELSTDKAGAIETVIHALLESENHYKNSFDIILIVEPTSPLRKPEDIDAAARLLINSGADSVVTVSPLSSKFHPAKALTVENGRLGFYEEGGSLVISRQSLNKLYWRNGVCYALTRACLLDKKQIFTDKTLPLIIDREIVNIDNPIELDWAEFLLSRNKNETESV